MIDELQGKFASLQREIASGPIVPDVTAQEIRTHLRSRYSFRDAMSLEEVTGDVEQMLRSWQVQVTHPRYFGLFNPSVTLASVVADTLVAMYNPQLANWRTSPAANEMERHTLAWLASRFGMPADASATFTTGGSEANLSAVVVALTKVFPGYGEEGLRGLSASPSIFLTREAHHSFQKIAHMTGLGRESLCLVATDDRLQMDIGDLERLVREKRGHGFAPLMVVGTAGTTAAGIIDPLSELGEFCRDEALWFHVDAAWGGGAVLSPRLSNHLAGIERADSITCDAHKWLSVPMASGMFFCRHPESVAKAFRADLSYMPRRPDSFDTLDPYTNSAQWSRRFIGLKLFMTIAEQGEAGCAAMVEHQTRMGDLLRELLAAAGWRIVNETPLPLVCFTREGLIPGDLLKELRESQVAWMSEAEVAGLPVMRACITSYKTTAVDIAAVVEQMNRLFLETQDPIAASAAQASAS